MWRRARACSLAASRARSSRISSSHRSTLSLWILHARHDGHTPPVSERIAGENGGLVGEVSYVRAEAVLEVGGEVLEQRAPGIQHVRHLHA